MTPSGHHKANLITTATLIVGGSYNMHTVSARSVAWAVSVWCGVSVLLG